MKQSLGLISLVVRDYDEAIRFFVGTLGFELVDDTFIPEQDKRWVIVSPPGATESRLLLARASTPEQASRIGAQTGGRVFLFLHTDDFWRDYNRYQASGVEFVRAPRDEPYGTVAVFRDLCGNLWDLIGPGAVSDPRAADNAQPDNAVESVRALFAAWNLPLPAIPADSRHSLRKLDAHTFATRTLPESPYHLRHYLDESAGAPSRYCVLAHSGHGVNSHALQYYVVNERLRLFLHLAWGGVYLDENAARANIRECLALADAIVAAVDAKDAKPGQLTIVASDFYGGEWWRGEDAPGWPLPQYPPAEVLGGALAALT